jgi:hypothetical protein
MEISKVDGEVEVSIIEGVAKLSFRLPTEMDLITAKGVVQQISQFIKVLDRTQTPTFSPPQRVMTNTIMNDDEKKAFIDMYENDGIEAAMAKYNMDKKTCYRKHHYYKRVLNKDESPENDEMVEVDNQMVENNDERLV